jgi:uncharacterized protein YdaU (DUF1376 family)
MKPPAFQFYADDFLAGTFSMSNEERGLYITLLCRQWTQGHVTRDEVARLGSTVVQPSINHVLTKFQPDADGNLKNARLEAERAKQNAFRELQSAKGKASAQARFNRGSTVVQPSRAPDVNSPVSVSVSSLQEIPPTPFQGAATKEDAKPIEPKPKGPLQLRAERIFRRKPDTPLDRAEERAMKAARAAIEATGEDDWRSLESYYAAKIPDDKDARRRSLGTLLNNWNGEIDRAKGFLQNGRKSAPETKLNFG